MGSGDGYEEKMKQGKKHVAARSMQDQIPHTQEWKTRYPTEKPNKYSRVTCLKIRSRTGLDRYLILVITIDSE
jgi:hypothetical protein